MRILVLTHENPYPPKGGFNNAIFETSRLLSMNNEVDIVSWGGNSNEEYDKARFRIFHIDENSLNDLFQSNTKKVNRNTRIEAIGSLLGTSQFLCTLSRGPSFKTFSERFVGNYDLILKEGPDDNRIARKLSEKCGIPLVERLHWIGLPWSLENYKEWYDYLNLKPGRGAELARKLKPALNSSIIALQCNAITSKNVITVTPYDSLRVKNRLLNANLSNIYSTQPEPEKLEKLRKTENGGQDYFVFFSSGTVFTGLTMLIIEKIAEHYPNLEFYIVGINLKPGLFKNSNIKTMGYLEEKKFNEILAESKGFIFPLIEGHGLQTKLITALSYGKPIIATSAITKAVTELTNGKVLLVRDTPSSFIDAIAAIIDDDGLKSKLSRNSIEVYDKHFSNAAHANNFLNYLKTII